MCASIVSIICLMAVYAYRYEILGHFGFCKCPPTAVYYLASDREPSYFVNLMLVLNTFFIGFVLVGLLCRFLKIVSMSLTVIPFILAMVSRHSKPRILQVVHTNYSIQAITERSVNKLTTPRCPSPTLLPKFR